MAKKTEKPEPTYIYGYGTTKHILAPTAEDAASQDLGLCGAPGGNPEPDESLPVCKNCLKKAESKNE